MSGAGSEDDLLDDVLGQLDASKLEAAAAHSSGAGEKPAGGQGPVQQQQPKQLDKEEFKHYITIYPCYLNPKLKMSQGRRVPLHLLAGCDDPWTQDIAEACGQVGMKRMVMEGGKRHPRDQWPSCQPFRLRVELKDKDGNLTAPGIPSKEVLLRKIAPIIPNLPNRRMRIEQMRMQREAFMAQQAAAQKAQAGSPVKTKKEDKAAAKKKGKK